MASLETLVGTVDRVVFRNAETHYTVVRLRVARRGALVVVGSLPPLNPGESIRVDGEWVQDRRFGAQLRARTCEVVPPGTADGIRRYLSSGLVSGIGPAFAERLVAKFGADTLKVIAETPERLREVDGIGVKRRADLVAALSSHRSVAETLSFLQGHGVTAAHALRIHRKYGDDAVRLVRETPYRVATDVHGIGFRTADAIAARLGFARDSAARIEAAVLHILREAAGDGHTCLPVPDLVNRCVRLIDVEPDAVRGAIRARAEAKDLVVEERPRPAVASRGGEADRFVFLRSLHTAEFGTALALRRLLDRPPAAPLADAAEVDGAARAARIELTAAQRSAVAGALRAPASILTGGPGVGKTTVVRLLVEVCRRLDRTVLLASPTGRAAKRLSEVAGAPASTLHRLLGFDPRRGRFAHDNRRPLAADLVVVDEASMLDVVLAYHLLRASRPPTRVLLVGDADQLPSVGPGTFLRDLVASERLPVARLTEIFRQRAGSAIVENAHRIRRGVLPSLPPKGAHSEFHFVDRADPASVPAEIRRLVAERIPAAFGLDPRRDVQVIAPMYRGEAGVDNLNRVLREALNPSGPSIEANGRLFRVGDRVVVLRNDYEKEVFNGDAGSVESVDPDGGGLVVRVDDRTLRFDRGELDDLAPAWAISVHRAQGSEYPAVVIPVVTAHYLLLRRSVLYTAVTRGRRLVVLVGSRSALALAVRNDAEALRHSLLADRLRAAAPVDGARGSAAATRGIPESRSPWYTRSAGSPPPEPA